MYCLFCWIWLLHLTRWIMDLLTTAMCGNFWLGLLWIKSSLSNRSFCVRLGSVSSLVPLCHGVYRMGHNCFHCISCCVSGISCHLYGDDCQLDLHFNHSDSSSIRLLFDCLSDAKSWMAQTWAYYSSSVHLLLTFRSLNCLAPVYLSDLLQLLLSVPKSWRKLRGHY